MSACVGCPDGRYGAQCLRFCECENGGACDPVDGRCSCTPGWTGRLCEQRNYTSHSLYLFNSVVEYIIG